jgi:hypothetical protein
VPAVPVQVQAPEVERVSDSDTDSDSDYPESDSDDDYHTVGRPVGMQLAVNRQTLTQQSRDGSVAQ